MTVAHAAKRRKISPPEPEKKFSLLSNRSAHSISKNDFYDRAAKWNLEQNYEQKPRKQKKKEKEGTRLPIKTADGRIEQLDIVEVADEDGDSWLESENDSQEAKPPTIVEEETKVSARQQILDAKEELAKIASHINEDPEENAAGFRILGSIAASKNPTVKKLALATQLAIYKDAIPGYRIRPIAEADQTEKVSKDVRRLRAFEQTLVSSYQSYIKDLAHCAKPSRSMSTEAGSGLSSVAISCACALLVAVPHFNFRGELLKILIAKLSLRRVDAESVKCRDAIETLFDIDDNGGSSLDAVLLITKMMKARNYQIHESVLNTFLHLRLLTEFSSKASQNRVDKTTADHVQLERKPKFKKEFRTKRQRKVIKERKVVEKEFKEADAIVSHEQRNKRQSETLKLVFVTYFKILKARIPNLMGAVLEGLAKYAHLINQDFFGDLLEALKDLVSDADKLLNPEDDGLDEDDEPTALLAYKRDYAREALLCTNTAFALLEGQDVAKSASALHLDLTFFTSHLYRNLHALSVNPDLELSAKSLRLADPHSISSSASISTSSRVNVKTTTVLLLRILTSILSSRTIPPIRSAAFTKQLFTCALQLPEKSAIAMLSLLTNITKVHGRKTASLWNTEERKGDGIFDPFRHDFESSNPFATTIWEGELLKLHYAPNVRDGAKGVEKIAKSTR